MAHVWVIWRIVRNRSGIAGNRECVCWFEHPLDMEEIGWSVVTDRMAAKYYWPSLEIYSPAWNLVAETPGNFRAYERNGFTVEYVLGRERSGIKEGDKIVPLNQAAKDADAKRFNRPPVSASGRVTRPGGFPGRNDPKPFYPFYR